MPTNEGQIANDDLSRWDNTQFDFRKALAAWYLTTPHEGLGHPEEQAAFSVLEEGLSQCPFDLLTAVLAGEVEVNAPADASLDDLKGMIFEKINLLYLPRWRDQNKASLARFLQVAAESRYEEWCAWTINNWSPELMRQMHAANAGLPIRENDSSLVDQTT